MRISTGVRSLSWELPILFWDQWDIVGNVASQVPGQNSSLNEGHLGDAQILVEERVSEGFLLPLLIGSDHNLTSLLGEFHGTSFPLFEMFDAKLLAVDESDGESISQPRAKLFHQIQGQRGSVGSIHMKEANKWIKPRCRQRGDAVVSYQSVKERNEAVDAIARGATTAGGEGEFLSLLFQSQRENSEVEVGGHALDPPKRISGIDRNPALSLGLLLSRRTGINVRTDLGFSQLIDQTGERVGCFFKLNAVGFRICFAGCSQQTVTAVLNFSGNDLPSYGCTFRAVVSGTKLCATERYAGIGHSSQSSLEVAEETEIIDRHTVFPTQVESRRAEGGRSENTDGFKMMNWDGDLAPIDRLVAGPVFRGQVIRIHRNLHLQREVVARDVGGGRSEVESVLLDIQEGCPG